MKLACQRYLDMIEMAKDPKCEFYFSPEIVCDYISFVEKFSHIETGFWEVQQVREDGTVDPHIYLEPYQVWEECAIHGFRLRRNGTRLVSMAVQIEPRKHGKTLRLAPAALFDLTCSGQMGAQIPIGASTAKQADDTLYGIIRKMVNNEPELVEQYGITDTKEEVKGPNGARIWKLTSIGERQDGLNPSLALFEEGHAGATDVYNVIRSAFGARPNALIRMITTAGYTPEGPAYNLMLEAQQVLTGTQQDYSLFAAIYTLDREDYLDPDSGAINWDVLLNDEFLIYKANPMYGVSLDRAQIQKDAKEARRSVQFRGEFARTRFNIWTGAGTLLIELESWMACKSPRPIEMADFIGEKAWIGVDMAQVLDMCAAVIEFELPNDTVAVFAKFFLPALSPTAHDPELAPIIQRWADDGWLELTPGPVADHGRVEQEIDAWLEVFDVQMIACDPHQAHNTVWKLWREGRPVMTYKNSQATMTGPVDDIIGRVASKRIIHDGNSVLAWNVSNTYGDRRGNGLVIPRKETENSKRKIDGFVALCFANGVRMQPQEARDPAKDIPPEDPYRKRGIIGYEAYVNG